MAEGAADTRTDDQAQATEAEAARIYEGSHAAFHAVPHNMPGIAPKLADKRTRADNTRNRERNRSTSGRTDANHEIIIGGDVPAAAPQPMTQRDMACRERAGQAGYRGWLPCHAEDGGMSKGMAGLDVDLNQIDMNWIGPDWIGLEFEPDRTGATRRYYRA